MVFYLLLKLIAFYMVFHLLLKLFTQDIINMDDIHIAYISSHEYLLDKTHYIKVHAYIMIYIVELNYNFV